MLFFFFSSRRRHTRFDCDWSSDVCSSDLGGVLLVGNLDHLPAPEVVQECFARFPALPAPEPYVPAGEFAPEVLVEERDTNQSHLRMIYRPALPVADARKRAALSIYATLLGGSVGFRLFEEVR